MEKSVSNKEKHVWNKSIFQNVSNKEHMSCIWYRRVHFSSVISNLATRGTWTNIWGTIGSSLTPGSLPGVHFSGNPVSGSGKSHKNHVTHQSKALGKLINLGISEIPVPYPDNPEIKK